VSTINRLFLQTARPPSLPSGFLILAHPALPAPAQGTAPRISRTAPTRAKTRVLQIERRRSGSRSPALGPCQYHHKGQEKREHEHDKTDAVSDIHNADELPPGHFSLAFLLSVLHCRFIQFFRHPLARLPIPNIAAIVPGRRHQLIRLPGRVELLNLLTTGIAMLRAASGPR